MNKYKFVLIFWIILSIISIGVSAIDQTKYFNANYTTNFVATNSRGPLVEANYNLILNNITKFASDGASRCRLLNWSNLVVLKSNFFVGNNCEIQYNLSKGQRVIIDTDNNGTSYTGYYNGTGPNYFPINSSALYFINGSNTGGTVLNPTQYWTLTYIYTTNITSSSNFSISANNNWNGSSINNFSAYIISNYSLIDSYEINDAGIGISNNLTYYGETFNISRDFYINNISLNFAKSFGTHPTGNLYVSIINSSNNIPFGNYLVNSSPINISSLQETGFAQWETFNFLNSYKLTANNQYALIVYSNDISGSELFFIEKIVGSYTNGKFVSSIDGGVTWSNSSSDLNFRIYGSDYYNNLNSNNTGLITTDLLSNDSRLFNITISSPNYFSQVNNSYNVSSNLIASLFMSQINLNNCLEMITNNSLTCLNQSTIYPNIGSYNFSNGVSGYFNVTKQFNISALDNRTLLFDNFYSTNLSINSISLISGSSLSNCTYTIQGITYPSYSKNIIGQPNITIGLINGSYTITDNCIGFALLTQNITINSSFQSLNFSLYTTNSINLTFIDVTTGLIINTTTLTVKFIGGTSQTNTTSTGKLYVDLLNPSDYTILTSGTGYIQNTYLLTIINQTYNPITIYMQPSTNLTYYVLFTIIDKLSRQPLQGATVTIQRYVNNAWVTEQVYNTDFNGRGQGYFVLNTEYYNFVITYNGITYSGALNSDANKKIIYYQDYLDGLGIEISLSQTNYINTIQGLDSVTTNLKYVNQTNSSGYFVYNWIDSNGNSRNATLNVYLDNVLNCTSSAISSSGSINCFVDANNSELFFVATTFIDGIPDKGMTQKVGVSPEWNFDWGIGGWIFTIFVVIIAFTAFAQIPALSIMLGSIFFALALFFNILFTQNANVSQLGIIIVFVAFLLAKIPSNSGVNG